MGAPPLHVGVQTKHALLIDCYTVFRYSRMRIAAANASLCQQHLLELRRIRRALFIACDQLNLIAACRA